MSKKNKIITSIILIIITTILILIAVLSCRNTKNPNIDIKDTINNDNPNTDIVQEEIFDNSKIGTLSIEKIGLYNVEIRESVELETLSHSIGHFENTNLFEGNVGLASHNAGTNANYFADLNKLQKGDEILYKTRYGTKKYIVDTILEIDSCDWSKLQETTDNRITLITCVSGNPSVRLCVQGVEK